MENQNANETQNNDNQTKQTDQLTDLDAPDAEEVKGGNSRSSDSFYGTGVYKTVDGGKTWT